MTVDLDRIEDDATSGRINMYPTRDVLALVRELRAAREVVEASRGLMADTTWDRPYGLANAVQFAISNYDQAVKGESE